MKTSRFLLLPFMALSLLTTSCQLPPAVTTDYQVKGVVRAVMPDKKTVTIAHEKIPGYMEAMTMDFAVTNVAELNGLKPGDDIAFRMTVTRDDGWIHQIRRTGTTSPLPAPAPETFRRARYVEPLAIGDAMPEYTFTNQLGRATRLSDFKGQACVLSFIFTRCPYPTFCPRQSKGLGEVQEQLKSMRGGPTNWHLLSITIDPAYDTAARLKGYRSEEHTSELQSL